MTKTIASLIGALALGAVLVGGAGSAGKQGSGCLAHRAAYIEGVFEASYDAGCSGHDEPELDPVSSASGSARNLTWTFVLPTDGAVPVSTVGPFWFGGTVSDPNSLGGQSFLEVQFYPDAVVTNCTPNGGYVLTYSPNTYSVCSPVWSIHTTGQKPNYHEPAAFNAMLTTGSSHGAMLMHAGDTISIHFHVVSAGEGWHVDVTDHTTGQSGTIVLNSADGPLLPAYDTQTIGNSLAWGAVYDTPNSFVWEIGHTSAFSSPASKFCLPGQSICDSYNEAAWAGFSPLRILSVTFGDSGRTKPSGWAVVSDYGGNAEIAQDCGAVGGPFCFYPYFSLENGAFEYGTNYGQKPVSTFGGLSQFIQTTNCPSPLFGPNSTYCDNLIVH